MEWGCAPLQLQTRGTSAMLEAARQCPASVWLAFAGITASLIPRSVDNVCIEASFIIKFLKLGKQALHARNSSLMNLPCGRGLAALHFDEEHFHLVRQLANSLAAEGRLVVQEAYLLQANAQGNHHQEPSTSRFVGLQ